MPPRCLVIAGEIFSPNLGDGIIYECLKYLLEQVDPTVQVLPLDISGRLGWAKADPHATTRLAAVTLAQQRLPRLYPYLNLLRLQFDYLRRLRTQWSAILAGADVLLVGGGKLLMDNHLDFPFKLNRLSHLARQHPLPTHLTALGVGERWSLPGKRLLEPLVRQAVTISLRDSRSYQLLQSTFGNTPATITCDPAIWAGEVFHPPFERNTLAPMGVSVVNPLDANAHLPRTQRWSKENLLDFYLQVISLLAEKNLPVEIFTNGNRQDAHFSSQLFALVQQKGLSSCSLAQRPTQPAELVAFIHHYRGVFASRLHAAILAASLDKPSIGLAWDEKIAAFYAQIGQAPDAFAIQNIKPSDVVDRLVSILQAQRDKEALQTCRQKALLNATLVLNAA